ncbi:hypothetical protein PR048_005501 [Dryococelus australis]|uniref:Uncharacterized protein n=1 Tax=Dryococelus australis TaxID=614101 RepID=A0ABQ9I8B6_9NEOP|nr:hypothetical protein PR048_005501 [Dryococelus australis]
MLCAVVLITNNLNLLPYFRPETMEDLSINTTQKTANEQEFITHKYLQDNNEQLTTTTDIVLEGRRMVDIQYLTDSIKRISRHEPFNCTFSDMSIINERHIGLITLKCKFCNITETLRTECAEKSVELLNVNTAVFGVISSEGATHNLKNYAEYRICLAFLRKHGKFTTIVFLIQLKTQHGNLCAKLHKKQS